MSANWGRLVEQLKNDARAIVQEPLPERWLDLIIRLNAEEDAEAAAERQRNERQRRRAAND
jgi:hypothetical protein